MDDGSSWVTVSGWLSREVLAVVGAFRRPAGSAPSAWLERDRARAPLPVRCARLREAEGARGIDLLTIAVRDEDPRAAIVLAAGDDEIVLPLSETTDVRGLARDGLAWLDSASRAAALEFLAETPAAVGAADLELCGALRLLRDALRDPLRAAVIGAEEKTTLALDVVARVDAAAFYVKGWLRSETAPLASLVAVSPEGMRVELADRICSRPRQDVADAFALDPHRARPGFVAYLELPHESPLDDGWLFELRDAAGNAREASAPAAVVDPKVAVDLLLDELAQEKHVDEELLREHLAPALARLQRRRAEAAQVVEVLELGPAPAEPDVTIVVPLYGRLDLLELQLAQLADDPDVRASELLYVLDSPDLAEAARSLAAQLHELYRLPFRLAILGENGGFAVAVNRGASLARGRLLLLLNSDVIPDRPGWLASLRAFHDATPGLGAVAPKLLYEDESIQHAGLYFHRDGRNPLWWNEHYFKGLHRSLPAAAVTRPVPAVTAACLLIARERFDELGGLETRYVQGDYEDSDLCLRLRRAGYDTWYLASVELYHLEAQSFPKPERERVTAYNRWLHTHVWGDAIESLTASWPDAEPARPAPVAATPDGRAAADAPHADPPTIRPQLTELVRRGLALPYTSESGDERILTGNHYQSVLLGGERTGGFRTPREDVLDRIRFDGKTVLDLGSNLGEISRAARARGAALVDGFEYDPFFVEVAQALNAVNDVTRVSFFRRDVTDPAVFTDSYDVVLAFSVWIYVQDVVERLAAVTRELLVVETHRLDGNLESTYIEPITRHFPYYAFLGDTEWSSRDGATERRAVIAFARTRAALAEGLTGAVAVARRAATGDVGNDGLRHVDSFRTPWYDDFFRTLAFDSPRALFAAVAAMELDVDGLARLSDGPSGMSQWPYWLLFVKGYLQYKAGALADGNVYVEYLLRFFGPRGGDPGISRELEDRSRAADRARARFRTMEAFEAAGEAATEDVEAIVVVSRCWPSDVAKDLYEPGAAAPVEASLLDGYHRLFAARLFGVRHVPARFFVQEDAELPALALQVEELAIEDGRLGLRGSIAAEADTVEVWCGSRFVTRVGVGNGSGPAHDFAVSAHWPPDADTRDLRIVATLGWEPVAAASVVAAERRG